MATPLNRLSIRARLVLLVGGALIVFALTGAYAVRSSIDMLERMHGERVVETGEVILAQIGANVASRLDQIVRTARTPAVGAALRVANATDGGRSVDPRIGLGAEASRSLRETFIEFDERIFARTVFASVLVTGRDGVVVADTAASEGPTDFADAVWWREARESGRYVGGMVSSSNTGTAGLEVAMRLDDGNGRMVGVARAVLSATWITREAAAATQLRDLVDILLTTRDGRLIFSRRPFRFLEDVSDQAFFRQASGPRAAVTLTTGGRSRLVAHATNANAQAIGPLGWSLFIVADRDVVLREPHDLSVRLTILLAVGAVVALLLTALLSVSLLSPLAALRGAARAMAGGDLSVRVELSGRDELADLGAAFNNMADRLQANEAALRSLATTDALTGVLNRRGFVARGRAEWGRCRRYGRSLAVLAVDIDHFKAVNDTHGHDVGDAVLVHVSALCAGGMRTSDLFGRLGGEEFCAILPETSLEAARVLAERLRAGVEHAPCPVSGLMVSVTISIGLAVGAESDATLEALMKRADQALYAAKRNGRNRVETSS
ncbi:sensor domain-containing diguanylate cyclase [Rhodospira trueperi]|uniref:diguanylate cyclase n=1 Tax=Rhodospira trueperi TaxID=69960 RepID=A0A1G7DZL1_9PROT|nr:diguanylate cyclase [Rhodospira trueperi]SDE56899.1 diguanylate cyclase (GGDEF) domain-containing protein [Rhodospira trueperi]